MPLDFRRFTGPESSTPYAALVPGATRTPEELRAALLDAQGRRADGRALDEPRPLSVVKTGVVSQAKGSAYIECGNTKAICSVFAPREMPNRSEFSFLGQLYCEVKYAPFSCRTRRAYAPEPDERALANVLRQALEPAVNRCRFPNFQVDIFVYILENDGGCLASAVTVAGLALADAAVPMYDIIGATTLAVLGDKMFLDPTEAEEYACLNNVAGGDGNHGVATLAVLPEIDQVTDYTQIGSMDMECVFDVMQRLQTACISVVDIVRETLFRQVQYDLEVKEMNKEQEKKMEELTKKRIEEFKKLKLTS